MKNILKIALIFIFFSLIGSSCGGGSDEPMVMNPDDGPINQNLPPASAELVFPENNTECNISQVLNDTQSTVTFMWNPAENADSYRITIRNLNSGTILFEETNNTQIPLTIERGTPYEWSITSLSDSSNITAESPTFRFFNEGPGIMNYAPFPANALNPSNGQSLPGTTFEVVLEWETADIDNDVLRYEVFFNSADEPSTSFTQTSENSIQVSVISGTSYFWRIVTSDINGNQSDSGNFEFQIE